MLSFRTWLHSGGQRQNPKGKVEKMKKYIRHTRVQQNYYLAKKKKKSEELEKPR